MDFEQYLEKDMLKFLDSKIQKKENKVDREEEYGLYMARDYLKELNYALDNDELTKAKKLFDELKKTYSKLPKTSYERKKIYALMEKMYAKIQNYVQIKEGRIQVIRQGESEIQQNTSERFATLGEIKEKRMDEKFDINKFDTDISKNSPTMPVEPTKTEDTPKDNNDNASVPIGRGEGVTPKTDTEDAGEEEKKTEPVEQNIIGNSINDETKDKIEEPAKEIKEEEHPVENTPSPGRLPLKYTVRDYDKDYDSKDADEIAEDIMEGSNNLEKLRLRAFEKILDEKLVKLINFELNKRLSEERYDSSRETGSASKNITSQKYIPSDEEEPVSFDDSKKKGAKIDKVFYQDTGPQATEFHQINRQREHSRMNFSNDDLKVIYEQAIYYMFDNQYEEAAKLFKKIISNRPTNKAARIRLQECVENHPELAEEYSDVYDPVLYTPSKLYRPPEKTSGYTGNDSNEGIENLEDAMKKINTLSEEQGPDKEGYGLDAKKMYDRATYAMLQNNYKDAAQIFKQILRIKPGYKAAKIRLKECLEAMGNA